MLFFYLFLISITLLGSFAIGPFTVRVYMTVIMIAFLLIKSRGKDNSRNVYSIPRDFITLFGAFLIIEFFALLLNGEFLDYEYPKYLLSRYIPCLVSFFAFDYFLSTPERCKKTFIFLTILIVINCLITLFQFYGNPLGLKIAIAFTNVAENENEIMNNGGRDDMAVFGVNSAVGLFQHTFSNGMYIASLGILIAGLEDKFNKYKILKLVYFLLVFGIIFACMTTQGRAPFLMLVLSFLLLFLRTPLNRPLKIVVVALVFIAAWNYLPSMIESESLGRISDQSIYQEDSRQEIWRGCLVFLKDHLILGGPFSYSQTGAAPPHNYFFNAFILSGLFGGIVASILFIRVMYEAIMALIKKNSSIMLISAAASIIIYMVNSLFHNASIITGDTLFFLIYPLFCKVKIMKV